MKTILLCLSLCFTVSLTAQDSFAESDARQLVVTFFEGFHAGDTIVMRSVLGPKVRLQTAFSDADGNPAVADGDIKNLLDAIASRPADQIWEERLLDYKVQIDGNLAHVWTPYQFWVNGTLSHCGANAFTIANTMNGWKIMHIIDSRRRKGCE